jgi:hypothetical protein
MQAAAIANLKFENSDERRRTFRGTCALHFAPFLRRDTQSKAERRNRWRDSRWCRQLRLSARSKAKRRQDAALQKVPNRRRGRVRCLIERRRPLGGESKSPAGCPSPALRVNRATNTTSARRVRKAEKNLPVSRSCEAGHWRGRRNKCALFRCQFLDAASHEDGLAVQRIDENQTNNTQRNRAIA